MPALVVLLLAVLSVWMLIAAVSPTAAMAWVIVGASVTLASMWQSRELVARVTLDRRFTPLDLLVRHMFAFSLASLIWPVIVPGLVRGRRKGHRER